MATSLLGPLQQVQHPVGQPFLAQDDVELARHGDLLQHFQLAQPHESWALGQQLGGVGLRTNCSCFLATGGEVGLRDLVHQRRHESQSHRDFVPDLKNVDSVECHRRYGVWVTLNETVVTKRLIGLPWVSFNAFKQISLRH